MKSLVVENLGKRYRVGSKRPFDLWALRNVSFTVEPGTILGVIGPNGAGKTTLLKVLSRVTPPTEGRVVGRGRVVPLLALGAGFQQDLSGRDNIYLNAAMYGISAAEVEARLDDIVQFAGLDDFLDSSVKRYSSGMYLRLAFSVAINMRPDILLADEVLAVGDMEFQERCLERVQESGRAGMTVLFVSHDMDAITRLCDRVIWINAGQMMGIGPPEQIVSEYQASAWSTINRRRQTKKSGGHVCKAGEIVFVRLVSAKGKEVGAIKVEDPVWVHIGFRTTLPRLEVRAQIDVLARGALAFRSVMPASVPVDGPADGVAKVQIPAHLLSETTYTISTSLAFFEGDEAYTCELDNATAFHVYDSATGASARGTYRGQLRGAVSPKLEWDMEAHQPAAVLSEPGGAA
ncbi:MAG TPA: polysaccharide ABC transporter ATP-binding protein [Vicinamibacterales bacterium]|nr:polysaccharide ABC transporter ATP-binding protein [Vicinamibacterales bacterium]